MPFYFPKHLYVLCSGPTFNHKRKATHANSYTLLQLFCCNLEHTELFLPGGPTLKFQNISNRVYQTSIQSFFALTSIRINLFFRVGKRKLKPLDSFSPDSLCRGSSDSKPFSDFVQGDISILKLTLQIIYIVGAQTQNPPQIFLKPTLSISFPVGSRTSNPPQILKPTLKT